MRKPIIEYAVLAALCVFCGITGIIFDSWFSPAQKAEAADTPILDVSGAWNSQFGAVQLKVEGKDADGQVVVSGGWRNGDSVGQIVYGRFLPATAGGVLQLEYYVPGRNVYGFADFKIDPARTTFKGKYFETAQDGEWILTRARGVNPSYLSKLNLVSNLGQNKRSTVLKDVTGIWDSTFGKVELKGTGYSQGVLVTGKFTRNDGKVGEIVSGSYIRDPKGGLLKFDYKTPWNNSKGTGTFRPDQKVPDRQLCGVYNEGGQSGQWILSRPLGK